MVIVTISQCSMSTHYRGSAGTGARAEPSCKGMFEETVKLSGEVVVEVNQRHLWCLESWEDRSYSCLKQGIKSFVQVAKVL